MKHAIQICFRLSALTLVTWVLSLTCVYAQQVQEPSEIEILPLPAGARMRLGPVWFHRDHSITSIAFSPDGKLSAYLKDGKVWLCDGPSCNAIGNFFLPRDGSIRSFDFSPDSKTMATMSYDKSLRLWDVGSRKVIRLFTNRDNRQRFFAWIEFSADGKTLAASQGSAQSAYLFDVATGQEIREFKHEVGGQLRLHDFTPDGDRLISSFKPDKSLDENVANEEPYLILWEVATGNQQMTMDLRLNDEEAVIGGAYFSPSDKRLLVAIHTQKAKPDEYRVLDWPSEKTVATLKITPGFSPFCRFAFSPDSKTLAAPGLHKAVLRWDVETGKPLRRIFTRWQNPSVRQRRHHRNSVGFWRR